MPPLCFASFQHRYAWLCGVRLSPVPQGAPLRTDAQRLVPLLRALRIIIPLIRDSGSRGSAAPSFLGLNPGVTRTLKLMLLLVTTCHWIGCLWWCVGELEQDEIGRAGTNVSVATTDPDVATPWGPSPWLKSAHQSAVTQYAHALLWGASMMTGFVPFDVKPSTLPEVTVTILALFFGLIVNTVFISSTTSALQLISFKSSHVMNKLDDIAKYMRHKRVPTVLARRIIAFYEYQLSPHRSGGQHDLAELPPVLAMELIMHTHQELFRECPIFHLIPPPTALSLVERFEPLVYVPDEVVIHEGAPNASLFVINRGLVAVWRQDNSIPTGKQMLTTLTDNDFFGEQTLLQTITSLKKGKGQPGKANATCQCTSYCDVFRLTSTDFMAVLDEAKNRRGSCAGNDFMNVLNDAAHERNSRADVIRRRSLQWAKAAKETIQLKRGEVKSDLAGVVKSAITRSDSNWQRHGDQEAGRDADVVPASPADDDEEALPSAHSPPLTDISREDSTSSLLAAAQQCVPGLRRAPSSSASQNRALAMAFGSGAASAATKPTSLNSGESCGDTRGRAWEIDNPELLNA
jgi:hypothetical protein